MRFLLLVVCIVISVNAKTHLDFYNIHTKEEITVKFKDGKVISSTNDIDNFLRDHRRNISKKIDVKVLENLYTLLKVTNNLDKKVEVISGFRHPKTNKLLRKDFPKMAYKSEHSKGKALDFRIYGSNLKKVFNKLKSLKLGGAGFYQKDNFIHIDTGDIRFWYGN